MPACKACSVSIRVSTGLPPRSYSSLYCPGREAPANWPPPLVALKTNTLLFQASGKILAMENENAGHLIDVLV